MTTKTLIIPAAGSGRRMRNEIPKPFLRLSGRTILEHTIRRFLPLEGLGKVLIATSERYIETAEEVVQDLLPEKISAQCLTGGKERQDSIANALDEITKSDLIIIHDAVRPFVKLEHIEACCRAASEMGAAVVGVPTKDTIKRIDENRIIKETPERKFLWQAQTPQIFQREVILQAYEKAKQDNFTGTDDASLVERLGREVKMVEGSRSNFKITYPLDLELAKLLIKKGE